MKHKNLFSKDDRKILPLKIAKYLFAVLLIAVIIIFWPRLRGLGIDDILSYTPGNFFLAFCVFLLIFIVKALTFIMPLVIIYLAAGIVFSPFWATVICVSGLFLGAVIMFYLGRFLGAGAVLKLAGKSRRMREIIDSPDKNSVRLMFVIRLTPIFPADLISLLWGASGAKFAPFIIGSVFGYLPGIIPFTIAGGYELDFAGPAFIIPLVIYIIIAVFALFMYYIKIRPGFFKNDPK